MFQQIVIALQRIEAAIRQSIEVLERIAACLERQTPITAAYQAPAVEPLAPVDGTTIADWDTRIREAEDLAAGQQSESVRES